MIVGRSDQTGCDLNISSSCETASFGRASSAIRMAPAPALTSRVKCSQLSTRLQTTPALDNEPHTSVPSFPVGMQMRTRFSRSLLFVTPFDQHFAPALINRNAC